MMLRTMIKEKIKAKIKAEIKTKIKAHMKMKVADVMSSCIMAKAPQLAYVKVAKHSRFCK
ncbi:hypothetical protein ES692_00680 [Psychroserpens burtonensis]|uniref:Uncharacterized protein n=1 Tax=Psychroserpens burtonensis TaxID=49278 RepID=A0A5C7BE67_9FLAO|nr:hypothetical protein [Psychroserpens burtonensis]TXE20338.1 hypothetical protein ES692_00680 [Psychroserpens burtonensis]